MANRLESEINFQEPLDLRPWDNYQSYSFFVTLNTGSKKSYFGRIRHEKFIYASMGIIAEDELIKTDKLLNRVNIDEYVILPYHIHAIINIENTNPLNRVPGINVKSSKRMSKQGKLLGILENYRNTVSMRCLEAGYDKFVWHEDYYCHPIMDVKSLLNIRRYIRDNPVQWERKKVRH